MSYVKLEDVAAKLEALHDDGTSIDGMIHRGELRAALRSLPTDDGWEDIENIKETDGMVLCAGKWPDGIKWRAIGQAFDGYAVGDWDECLEPTHFGPLPAPPAC